MSRLDPKHRKKMKREAKKQRQLKAQIHSSEGTLEKERLHSGKIMASILIIMALFGAAAIILAYS